MVKCFVVGCSTGYKSAKENDAKVFKPPKEEKGNSFYGERILKEVTENFQEKIMFVLDILKKKFIIKNSVNGGAPLSRWKLRDDAIPTLVLGYKDGVAPNKKYRKKTTSPFSNNGCHKQPEEKIDGRTTSDVNSAEVTLAGENGLEHTTQGTRDPVSA
ncbi:uncharacterized protein LOC124343073 [Daphnia pulicaria]|uniref:uncharacterized protein LOC124343073 n=1 Tax=Daphnia pulicaria TaxID=35523 RepID=UPI001EEA950C|nr:uncharacterized protein LOC124343073 [Daphnia pulicaria]